jgi:hypothetical protein
MALNYLGTVPGTLRNLLTTGVKEISESGTMTNVVVRVLRAMATVTDMPIVDTMGHLPVIRGQPCAVTVLQAIGMEQRVLPQTLARCVGSIVASRGMTIADEMKGDSGSDLDLVCGNQTAALDSTGWTCLELVLGHIAPPQPLVSSASKSRDRPSVIWTL